jgi:photosystem I P700 chlorophyll a apoprotein A2
LGPLLTGQWNLYAQNPDSSNYLFGTTQGAGTVILTLLGGFHPQTQSLWLTDIAHHHLAIAFIFLIAGHMYRTNFGIGQGRCVVMELTSTTVTARSGEGSGWLSRDRQSRKRQDR